MVFVLSLLIIIFLDTFFFMVLLIVMSYTFCLYMQIDVMCAGLRDNADKANLVDNSSDEETEM